MHTHFNGWIEVIPPIPLPLDPYSARRGMTEDQAVRAVLYSIGIEIAEFSIDHTFYRYERKRMFTIDMGDRWATKCLRDILRTLPVGEDYLDTRIIKWKNYIITLNEQPFTPSNEVGAWQRREAEVCQREEVM